MNNEQKLIMNLLRIKVLYEAGKKKDIEFVRESLWFLDKFEKEESI